MGRRLLNDDGTPAPSPSVNGHVEANDYAAPAMAEADFKQFCQAFFGMTPEQAEAAYQEELKKSEGRNQAPGSPPPPPTG